MSKKISNQTPDAEKQNKITGSKMDMIKDLIFGENIQEYDSQFQLVKEDIEAKKEELEGLVQSVRTELNEMIDNLGTDINIRVTQLEDKMKDRFETLEEEKVDRESLGNLLITLGEKITKG